MSSFIDDPSVPSVSSVAGTHLGPLRKLEPPDDVEMGDEYLLSIKPHQPLNAPSTPTSNSPSLSSSRRESQGTPDLRNIGPLSRGTSPDVTSSPSELSRRIGASSSHTSARSPSAVPDIPLPLISQPQLVDPEPRPGPEDAEGSTRRWSFRSRKANQLQPYRFDRLQYKQQLRGNPEAVVTALNPHRRRSSPGLTMDQDFIADDDEENTQETSGLTFTEGEENESQSRDNHHPRRIALPRASPPAQSPPQWYLDEMEQISGTDSDDDEVVGYLAGRSREKQQAAEADDGRAPAVSYN